LLIAEIDQKIKQKASYVKKVGGKMRSIRNKYSAEFKAKEGIESYFKFYNNERPHQSLGYKTPYEVYYGL